MQLVAVKVVNLCIFLILFTISIYQAHGETTAAGAAPQISHSRCIDPLNNAHNVKEFRDNQVRGTFCGRLSSRLGLANGVTEDACIALMGKFRDDGWCTIVISVYKLTQDNSVFCAGIASKGYMHAKILLRDPPNSGGSAIEYEWSLVGYEKCEISKRKPHEATDSIAQSVDTDLHQSKIEEPSALRSTNSLLELYKRTWNWAIDRKVIPDSDWKCIVHPRDRKDE